MSAKGIFCQNGTNIPPHSPVLGNSASEEHSCGVAFPNWGLGIFVGRMNEERNLYFCVQLVICLWIWSFGAVRFLPTRNI